MRTSYDRSSSARTASLMGALLFLGGLASVVATPAGAQPRRLTADMWQKSAWDTVFRRADAEAEFKPLHWGDRTTLLSARLRFSKYTLELPEFDDQQKLPTECSGSTCAPATYGPLATIFPTDHLERWTTVDFQNMGSAGIPVAEICSESRYASLGIEQTVTADKKCDDPNTLFIVLLDGRWGAFMRSPTQMGGNPEPLEVERATFEGDAFCRGTNGHCGDSIPPVARFDWVRNTLTIGVRCADGWCDVMAPPRWTGRPDVPGTAASPSRERVKGWHDRQHLMNPNGMPTGPFLDVTPVDSLASIALTSFALGWRTVAYIARPHNYKTLRDNSWMIRGGMKRNEVQIYAAGGAWRWRMLYIGQNDDTTYSQPRAVKWTPHVTIPTPATARWRWKANDEMIWIRCANGCCELTDS